ncbi:MAG: hypothetical protein OEW45_15645 [Deltaproteobacteria bacterium]|nr:hypothetical protein [Deltaproteobacteria bacterium]
MEEKKALPKKLSMSNTKQEMMEAYQGALKLLEEKRETELKPEKKLEEKKTKEAVRIADSLSSEGVVQEISGLKIEIGKVLTQIGDKLEDEVNKFKAIQSAIELREKELQELYEIEKAALTLAALIETQNQKRQQFEAEMAGRKEELNQDIQTQRLEWAKEKEEYEAQIKERDLTEKKRREREKEEYDYSFKRQQMLAKDKFEDERARLEKEIQLRKAQMEGELKEREKLIAQKEEELNELRKKVSLFPKEMETTVGKAVKETTEKLILEAKNREELLKKEFIGERNVLTTRIESLEKTVKEQSTQIAGLTQFLEKANQKVQEIAVKALESSSAQKSLSNLQQLLSEQMKKPGQEK